MKRKLAVRRWWIAGFTIALVATRIAIAAAFSLLGLEPAQVSGAIAAAFAVCDATCLALAVVSIVAFVQYGRIFNARIPTE